MLEASDVLVDEFICRGEKRECATVRIREEIFQQYKDVGYIIRKHYVKLLHRLCVIQLNIVGLYQFKVPHPTTCKVRLTHN